MAERAAKPHPITLHLGSPWALNMNPNLAKIIGLRWVALDTASSESGGMEFLGLKGHTFRRTWKGSEIKFSFEPENIIFMCTFMIYL